MQHGQLRLFRILATVFFVTLMMSASTMTSARADLDDSQVTIDDVNALTTYRFPIAVPEGGRLQAADSGPDGQATHSDILVKDGAGSNIGAYDAAWALDAAGMPVDSDFRIEGTDLVQTVHLTAATEFPVTFGLIYSPVVAGSGQSAPGPDIDSDFVSVPSNYVYDPELGSLHDYCTSSPDEFPGPFADNADFRGPCARHDLCYAGTASEFTCDNSLWSDMRTNCAYVYSWYNPLRETCYTTADIYWAAVVVA